MLSNMKLIAIAAVLGLLSIAGGVSTIYYAVESHQLKSSLDTSAKTIKTQSEKIIDLKVAIAAQNYQIDEMAQLSEESIQRSKQKLAEAQDVIKAQERRIFGIRSAQKAETCEDIRKMLIEDAML